MKKLISIFVLIAFSGCKATVEQQASRAAKKSEKIAKRALADSLYLAQKNEYMIEQQGQNFPESQDQDHNN